MHKREITESGYDQCIAHLKPLDELLTPCCLTHSEC